MYSISEVAARLDVARSTLLYYERIGLISPQRNPDNGYRRYSQQDLAQLFALKQLQRAGLSLKECQLCLQGALPNERIRERLSALEREIRELHQAQSLLQAISGEGGSAQSRAWHEEFEQRAPDAHFQWLREQGFSEMEALQIRWCSKDMTENDDYMDLFYRLFEGMERQGPGDNDYALQVLSQLPEADALAQVLDMGCGTGAGALLLAEHTAAHVTALDNYQPFLDRLSERAQAQGVGSRVTPVNGSMFEPPFDAEQFDLVWAEGCAYLMGFDNALNTWRSLLGPGGYLFITEMSWFTDSPSAEAESFWHANYPDMQHATVLEKKAHSSGYQVLHASHLPQRAWEAFYADMAEQIDQLHAEKGDHRVFEECQAEMDIYRRYGTEFGYHGLLLKKV